MDELRDKVLIAEKNDGFNNYRSIYNDIIEEKIIAVSYTHLIMTPATIPFRAEFMVDESCCW